MLRRGESGNWEILRRRRRARTSKALALAVTPYGGLAEDQGFG